MTLIALEMLFSPLANPRKGIRVTLLTGLSSGQSVYLKGIPRQLLSIDGPYYKPKHGLVFVTAIIPERTRTASTLLRHCNDVTLVRLE